MKTVVMHVGLKIPDTTAITAYHTIKNMGYEELVKLSREIYYEFDVLKDTDKFQTAIKNIDILVNANKNYATTFYSDNVPTSDDIKVLITNTDLSNNDLLFTLRDRLGMIHINKLRTGIIWTMKIKSDNPKDIAEKIVREILFNEHFQDFEFKD